MNITVNDFDLESLTEIQTGRLATLVSGFPINGYSRQDLEAIEAVIPGAFSALDDFNFKEIPTYSNTVHYNLVHKRLDELTEVIKTQMNSKYEYYLKLFSSTIKELESLSTILNTYNTVIPKPLTDDLTCIYIGDNHQYDLTKITEADFSKIDFRNGIRIPEVSDSSLNLDIIMFNDVIKSRLAVLDSVEEYRVEFSGYILKYLLDVPTLSFDVVTALFANSKVVVEKIAVLIKEIIAILSEFRTNLLYDNCVSSDVIERWVARCINTSKYLPIANDKQSALILDLLGVFRYYRQTV